MANGQAAANWHFFFFFVVIAREDGFLH